MKNSNSELTLIEVQKQTDQWVNRFEESYFSPLSMFACLVEETGELGKVLNHLHGEKKKKIEDPRLLLEEEIGDILFSLACIANYHEVSMDSCFEQIMNKFEKRDTKRWTPKK